jgi:hypothetical protein
VAELVDDHAAGGALQEVPYRRAVEEHRHEERGVDGEYRI